MKFEEKFNKCQLAATEVKSPQMHRTSTIVDQSRYRSPPRVSMEIVNC